MTSKDGRTFECYTDMVEVTYGGIFGGPADTHRRFEPGLKHWAIDGVPVTEDVYMQEARIAFPEFFDADGNLKS